MIFVYSLPPLNGLQGSCAHRNSAYCVMLPLLPMLSCRTRLFAHAEDLRNLCVDVGLDGSLESLGVGTDDLSNLVAVLEEEEGGHGANAEFLCDVRDLVDVKLEEAGAGVCAGESAHSVSNDRDAGAGFAYLTT